MRRSAWKSCNPGDKVQAVWRARLQEQLGFWNLEILWSPSGFIMALPARSSLVHLALTMVATFWPAGSPCTLLYHTVDHALKTWVHPCALSDLVSSFLVFEHTFLNLAGYGTTPWADLDASDPAWAQRHTAMGQHMHKTLWQDKTASFVRDLRRGVLDPLVEHCWLRSGSQVPVS
jgi:hypothetical protein